jgi:signal transduction histidine kinase
MPGVIVLIEISGLSYLQKPVLKQGECYENTEKISEWEGNVSIRSKWTITMIIVSIIPFTALGLIAMRNSKNALKERIAVSSLEYANLAMTTISVYLYEELEENQILASLDTLQEVVTDDRDGHISKLLNNIEAIDYDKDDYYLACLNVKGQVVASSNPEIIGIDFSNEGWFREALNGKDGMQDVMYHKPAQGYAIILSSPIKDITDSTKVIGVMFTALEWDEVNQMSIGLKIGGKEQTESDHIMLTNKDGLVISCFDSDEMFTTNLVKIGMKSAKYAQEGKEGHLTEISEHGFPSFAIYSRFKKYRDMPNLGWLLVMHQDPKSAFAPLARLQNTFIFIGIITGIFIVAISFIVSKTLSKPILSIANAAQAIGKGDLKRKVPVTTKDELGILAASFNKMTNDLEKAMTAQRQAEDALEHTVEVRTRELRETLKKVEDANLLLEQAARAKTEFLSSMSHELRTPLNAILGFSDLLCGQHFGNLNDKQIKYVNQIDDSGKHLLSLISDMLDVSRIDAGAMELELEDVSPSELINATVSMMSSQFKGKKISVKTSIEPTLPVVTADLRKCKQILMNLLSNALKYTPEGGRVEIRAARSVDLQARIEVRDTGIGIEADERDKIFSEFYQADSVRDGKLGGTGIGLALTRRLVELHGGEIGVESEPGKGSTFWFTLPLKKVLRTKSTK